MPMLEGQSLHMKLQEDRYHPNMTYLGSEGRQTSELATFWLMSMGTQQQHDKYLESHDGRLEHGDAAKREIFHYHCDTPKIRVQMDIRTSDIIDQALAIKQLQFTGYRVPHWVAGTCKCNSRSQDPSSA